MRLARLVGLVNTNPNSARVSPHRHEVGVLLPHIPERSLGLQACGSIVDIILIASSE
jgi:hydrogenase maturation factor HypF (carbamoyltransferase family)